MTESRLPQVFDWLVIGAGSAGVRAARLAAQAGAKVAIIEQGALGGTCVNLGCIPKKLFVTASQFAESVTSTRGFGWQIGELEFSWPQLRDAQLAYIAYLNGVYERLLMQNGVTIIRGHRAVFIDEHQLQVGDQRLFGKQILIATGGAPVRMSIPGAELAKISDQMFGLEQQPKHILIVGSGYIGLEFAGIFAGLGTQVDLCFRQDLPLKGFDEGLRQQLMTQLRLSNIRLLPANVPIALSAEREQYRVCFQQGQQVDYDQVLMATGRQPNTQSLQLATAGVRCSESGAVLVDDFFRSSQPHIFALGDVIDRTNLTPVAIAQAQCLMNNFYSRAANDWQILDERLIASAVFSQPEVASIGLTQRQAEQRGPTQIYSANFRPLSHGLSGQLGRCWMKMVVDKSTQCVLGLHMIGPHAAEIIQGFAVAVTMRATKADFDRTFAIHPTLAEEWVLLRE
jgi:glutathione reductase (NADPH)